MPIITNLQPRTQNIFDKFIKDIAPLTVNNDSEHKLILGITGKLSSALIKLGAEEFSKIFILNTFTSSDAKENEKYQEILNRLITAIIENYQQTDLLHYFFPEYLSQKESRPEYSSNLSRINYGFQLIAYWLRQLFNKPRYELQTEHSELGVSIEQLKTLLNKETYFANSIKDDFKQHLAILREKIQGKAIFPKREEINPAQALQAFEKDLQNHAIFLSEKEKEYEKKNDEVSLRERIVIQNERKNKEVAELYREERKAVNDNLKQIREKQEIENKELRVAKEELENLKEESKSLKEKNSNLEVQLNEIDKNRAYKLFLKKFGSNGAINSSLISFLEEQLNENEAQIRFLKSGSEPTVDSDLISFSDSLPVISKQTQASQASVRIFDEIIGDFPLINVEASTSQQSIQGRSNLLNIFGIFSRKTKEKQLERRQSLSNQATNDHQQGASSLITFDK